MNVIHVPSIPSLLTITITLLITILLNSLLRSYIRIPKKLDTRRGRTYVAVVRSSISIVLFAIALHIIFLILGINIAPLLASAGILGLAIGIGARSLIEDLIAGFFLLTQSSIGISDYVKLGSGTEGIIEDIGFRTITLRELNGALTIIPNGQVKQVINYSQGKAVVDVDIPVKSEQNIDTVIRILNEIVQIMAAEKKTDIPLTSGSKVLGIQNIQLGNCILIRVRLITTHHYRESIDQEFRYRVIKAFEKHKIHFA